MKIIFLFLFAYNMLISQNENFIFKKKSNFAFEENKGQVQYLDSNEIGKIKFVVKLDNLTIYIKNSTLIYQFEKSDYPENYFNEIKKTTNKKVIDSLTYLVNTRVNRIDMKLLNINPKPKISTYNRSVDYVNYYNFNVLDVHSYQKIIIEDIYPSIDWVIYIQNNQLKYDFIIHPNGNYKNIQISYNFADSLYLDDESNFCISTKLGNIIENKPITYQNDKILKSKFIFKNQILSFNIDSVDSCKEFIIDPVIEWGTYYGTNSTAYSIALDNNSDIYLYGNTSSSVGIAFGGFQNIIGGDFDCMIVKFSKNGLRQWATYYGGSQLEGLRSESLSVDKSNNIYICGTTYSNNNIAFNGFQNTNTAYALNPCSFLAKFNSSGYRLWATYYCGDTTSRDVSCYTDIHNNIYLAGSTNSSNLGFNGYKNIYTDSTDGFLVKFDSSGSRLWSTYYGDIHTDVILNVTVDSNDNVYVCGFTNSNNNIAFNGSNLVYKGNGDGFITKFRSNGQRVWGAYYGGVNKDGLSKLKILNNKIYIFGYSESLSGFINNGYQNTFGGELQMLLFL